MTEHLIETFEDGVATLTMNRPEARNALTGPMGAALAEAVRRCSADTKVRAIVLTGAGGAFCAGGDLKERNGMTDESWRSQHLIFERMVRAMMACPIPLLAAVNGAAYGGGAPQILRAMENFKAALRLRLARGPLSEAEVKAIAAELDGAWRAAVANLGRRPTIGKLQENFEVHVFDFAADLYGKTLRVQLVDFIRPEMKFSGLDQLKAQIAADGQAARTRRGA